MPYHYDPPSNKWINSVYWLPFQWHSCNGKHLPAQIIYPRVYSLIRSEKSRSIRNAHRVSFEDGRHSQMENICYRATILKGLPCHPSTVAMKSPQSTKEYFNLHQGRSNTVEMKCSTPSSGQSVFQQFIIAIHTSVLLSRFAYRDTRL